MRAEWRKPGLLLRADSQHMDLRAGRLGGKLQLSIFAPLQRATSGQSLLSRVYPNLVETYSVRDYQLQRNVWF